MMKTVSKVGEVARALVKDGWYLASRKGSHQHYKHEVKAGKVTLSGNPSKVIPPGTLLGIYKQAGWR